MLKSNHFRSSSLIFSSFQSKSNNDYGEVKEVLHLPANDVLSVLNNNQEYLVPMIDDVIIMIDIDSKKIIINPIKGLF